MSYWLTFLEGVVSFVSPCMLPLLPVYVAYFAADEATGRQKAARAFAFVCGFSTIFILLGVFAGSLGAALAAHRTAVNVVCGAMVIVFGLGYLGLFKLPFSGVKGTHRLNGVVPAFLFGFVYSVNLTPCVGAFLGAALMQAASEGGAAKGALLLLAYSLGLGVPFVVSALLLGRFGSAFGFIKRHYNVINPVCGGLLVVFGAWMIAGNRVGAPGGGRGATALPDDSAAVAQPASVGSALRADRSATDRPSDSSAAREVAVTGANFEAEVLKADRPVLVDFWAPWCGPCRMLAPHVAAVAQEMAGRVKVCKVNVDEEQELAMKYGVNGIPALFVFKGGKVVANSVGYVDREKLMKFVEDNAR